MRRSSLARDLGLGLYWGTMAPFALVALLLLIGYGPYPFDRVQLIILFAWSAWFYGLAQLLSLRRAAVAPAVILGVFVTIIAWPHPRKDFINDLDSIQPGMSVDEVLRKLGHYKGGTKFGIVGGTPPSDYSGYWYTGWNDDDDRYDADLGQVLFSQGRVQAVKFLPD